MCNLLIFTLKDIFMKERRNNVDYVIRLLLSRGVARNFSKGGGVWLLEGGFELFSHRNFNILRGVRTPPLLRSCCYRYNNLLINEYLCSFDNDMKSAMETFFLHSLYIRREVEEKRKKTVEDILIRCVFYSTLLLYCI